MLSKELFKFIVGLQSTMSALAISSSAQGSTLTLKDVESLPPYDAARIVFGSMIEPGAEILPRIGNHGWSSGVVIFNKPREVLGICEAQRFQISFQSKIDHNSVSEQDQNTPLEISQFQSGTVYYLDSEASNLHSRCASPVGQRPVFEAPSLSVAVDAIKGVQDARAIAAGEAPLPFQIEVQCGIHTTCPDAAGQRSQLARINPQSIVKIQLIGWRNEDIIEQIEFAPDSGQIRYWNLRVIYAGVMTSTVKKIELYDDVNAMQ